MILWLRTRRIAAMVATLVVVLTLGVMLGRRSLVLPTLFGTGANGVLATTFLPLAWAVALADGFAARCQAVEARPATTRTMPFARSGVLDAGLFIGAVTLAASSYAALVVPSGTPITGLGPVMVLSGVACVGTVRAGPAYGTLAASMLLIATIVYGPGAPGSPFVRVVELDGDARTSFGCGLVVCVLVTWLLLTDRVTRRLGATERLS